MGWLRIITSHAATVTSVMAMMYSYMFPRGNRLVARPRSTSAARCRITPRTASAAPIRPMRSVRVLGGLPAPPSSADDCRDTSAEEPPPTPASCLVRVRSAARTPRLPNDCSTRKKIIASTYTTTAVVYDQSLYCDSVSFTGISVPFSPAACVRGCPARWR